MKTPMVNYLKPITKPICSALLLALFSLQAQAANPQKETKLFAAANHVELKNGEVKPFIGNGFILKHKGKHYGVTAKHVLFELRNPQVTHIDIDQVVKSWQFKPFNSEQKSIVLGPIVNRNDQEKLDMQVLQNDYLLFEIARFNNDFQVLEISDKLPAENDRLVAYGCSYANQNTCVQNQYVGRFLKSDGNNLRVKLDNYQPGKLRGLSGGPVLDEQGKLVGIVSNVLPSKDGSGHDFAPANLIYLKQILDDLEHQQG